MFSLAEPALADNHQECVGAYEFGFPNEVDVATTTPLFASKGQTAQSFQFPDGQPANLSSFMSGGDFEIIVGITASDYFAYKKSIADSFYEQSPKVNKFRNILIPASGRYSFAFSDEEAAVLGLFDNGQMVFFSTAAADPGTRLKETIDGLRFRKNFEIPVEKGMCLPGIFVSSSQIHRHDIGVTFRLKNHPDVTIFFREITSGFRLSLPAQKMNEFIWQYSGLGSTVKLDHDPISFHQTTLAGRKGVSSFGTITRDDGTTDYGYLATVQGDPNAAVDTPDLTLLVQRTAKYAKGNPPVSKDELKQIAKNIAASIKRRPAQ
ncbi:hypothetical protein A9R05_24430 [Burkholderia sp. KK1]|nr:hypothetical protein A9R05_24430 [Burkholderia sp. KK1]